MLAGISWWELDYRAYMQQDLVDLDLDAGSSGMNGVNTITKNGFGEIRHIFKVDGVTEGDEEIKAQLLSCLNPNLQTFVIQHWADIVAQCFIIGEVEEDKKDGGEEEGHRHATARNCRDMGPWTSRPLPWGPAFHPGPFF